MYVNHQKLKSDSDFADQMSSVDEYRQEMGEYEWHETNEDDDGPSPTFLCPVTEEQCSTLKSTGLERYFLMRLDKRLSRTGIHCFKLRFEESLERRFGSKNPTISPRGLEILMNEVYDLLVLNGAQWAWDSKDD